MSHTPQGVDRLLIRPARYARQLLEVGVGQITGKTPNRVNQHKGHDTTTSSTREIASKRAPPTFSQANIRKLLFLVRTGLSPHKGANRDGRTVTGHTPQGVDRLLIRPATERPAGVAGCRTYQRKDTNPVRAGLGHDTPLTPILASLHEAPPILTEQVLHRTRAPMAPRREDCCLRRFPLLSHRHRSLSARSPSCPR